MLRSRQPGSTIKPFIAGPALQWKVTRPDEVWHTGGKTYITPYGRHITDVHSYGNPHYTLNPQNLWATNMIAALLGISFFLVVVLAEKAIVHRAPEHVA